MNKSVRIVGWIGVGIIIAVNLGVLLFLGLEMYAIHTPGPLVVRDAKGVSDAFSNYKDRVDNLQKLVTVLIGLSSLYALSLGFTTFLSAQQYLQTVKENADKSEKALAEARATVAQANQANTRAQEEAQKMHEQFPTFDRMTESIERMTNRIRELLPETGNWTSQHYSRMTPQQHEEVLLYEKSIAVFEVLNPAVINAQTLDLYLRLSRYYRARYDAERRIVNDSGGHLPRNDSSLRWSPRERAVHAYIERAKFYLDKYASQGDDFVALNERGIIAYKLAVSDDFTQAAALFQLSTDREPEQQRAYYWLSIIQHRKGQYLEAEATLSSALRRQRWERQANSERVNDILYNRSCARSRLAQNAQDTVLAYKYSEDAMRDLETACPGPDEFSVTIFAEDTGDGGDLVFLKQRFPERVEGVRRKLSGYA